MVVDPLVTSIQTPQFYYDIHSHDRFYTLCRVLDMHVDAVVVVFCRTKKDVDHMSEKLSLLSYRVSSYHGDLSPAARDRAWKSFVERKTSILIVTDIPQQLDGMPDIDLALFSIVPQDPDSYIQRIIRLESVIQIKEVATLITQNEFKKIAFIKRVTKTSINQKFFLPPQDVIKLKQDDLLKQIKSYDVSTLDEHVTVYAKTLLAEMSPDSLVACLLSLGFQGAFLIDQYKDLKTGSSSSERSKKKLQSSLTEGLERLFIAIGKADGINDQMLIDFLHQETSIDKEQFSDIKIFDTFSFFVVSDVDAEIILEIFRRKKRGKRSIVERAKGKDAVKKSKSS